MLRRPALAFALALALAAGSVALGGCTGEKAGAVGARWRLVDAASGNRLGTCSLVDQGAGTDLVVDRVTVDIATPEGEPVACASCSFACLPLEGTSNFEVPAGTYRFSLSAWHCRARVGATPAPVLRQVTVGAVTNLKAIEILVAPGERTTVDDSGTQALCDGGGGDL